MSYFLSWVEGCSFILQYNVLLRVDLDQNEMFANWSEATGQTWHEIAIRGPLLSVCNPQRLHPSSQPVDFQVFTQL